MKNLLKICVNCEHSKINNAGSALVACDYIDEKLSWYDTPACEKFKWREMEDADQFKLFEEVIDEKR